MYVSNKTEEKLSLTLSCISNSVWLCSTQRKRMNAGLLINSHLYQQSGGEKTQDLLSA